MSDPRCGTYAGWNRHNTIGEKPCEACRQARRDYQSDYRARVIADPATTHGYLTYSYGCRCEICKAARAEYSREKRAAAAQTRKDNFTKGRYTVPGISHGISGYQNHGCRCWTCTEAKSSSGRRESRRKQAAS